MPAPVLILVNRMEAPIRLPEYPVIDTTVAVANVGRTGNVLLVAYPLSGGQQDREMSQMPAALA